MGLLYEKEYEVHYYEVDANLKCNLLSIMNYFSDISNKQSESLGVGIDYLNSNNLTWVYYKYDIQVNRYPEYEEKIKVTTRGKEFKKFYASREFKIYDKDNNEIVSGEAIFLLMDTVKRRAVRIPDEQYIAYGVEKKKDNGVSIEKIEKLTEEHGYNTYKVRYSDIDSNKHVNNVKYVDWAIDSLKKDILMKYSLNYIEILFQRECYYGDTIKASYQIKEENDQQVIVIHKIEDEEGKELTLLRTSWKAK